MELDLSKYFLTIFVLVFSRVRLHLPHNSYTSFNSACLVRENQVLPQALLSFFCLSFGSKFRSRKLGVIYNDQLWDALNLWVNEFHLELDALKPRKRPMSLASPAIILDESGSVKMVIGAAGGKYIATALSQVNDGI